MALSPAFVAEVARQIDDKLLVVEALWDSLAAEPDKRWIIMQRFYGLNQPLIERFYAGRSTVGDKVRILTGRPPVAILRALKCLPQRSAAAHVTEVLS